MEILNVLAAALASFVFGGVWYTALAKPWMAAVDISEDEIKGSGGKGAYIIAFLSAVVVAGMMRHIFNLSGIVTIDKGMISGLGLGLFIATPWIVTNYAFSMRPRALTLIDGGFATIGCTIIGLVLSLF